MSASCVRARVCACVRVCVSEQLYVRLCVLMSVCGIRVRDSCAGKGVLGLESDSRDALFRPFAPFSWREKGPEGRSHWL